MTPVIRLVVGGYATYLEAPHELVALGDAERGALLTGLLRTEGASSVEIGHWQTLPVPPVPRSERMRRLASAAAAAGAAHSGDLGQAWRDLSAAMLVQGADTREPAERILHLRLAEEIDPLRHEALARLLQVVR